MKTIARISTPLTLLLVALLSVFAFSSGGRASAAASTITGYAWSDTIGWISLSGSGYGLSVESNGDISGYAWSDTIGWVSANQSDLTSCPSGACKAKLAGNNLQGWLKAISAQGDGWDGWISLSGSSGGGSGSQTFTSSGTFTVPASFNSLTVQVWGGGGGGGAGGGGGGGGGYATRTYSSSDLAPGTNISVTVGTGGAGAGGSNSVDGGTSSFGNMMSASGGGLGKSWARYRSLAGGAGGTGSGGTTNLSGSAGTDGNASSNGSGGAGANGGSGGAGSLGAGGTGEVIGGGGGAGSTGGGGARGEVDISWSGAGSTYGPTLSNGNFSGYSWGSDVVGWVDWSLAHSGYTQCTAHYYCSANDLYQEDAQCNDTFVQTCSYQCANTGGVAGCIAPPPPTFASGTSDGGFVLTGHLQVAPSLIASGLTSHIYWNVGDVSTCSVSENNPAIQDSWSGASAGCSGSSCSSGTSGKTTSAISQQTIYTLSCTGLDSSTIHETATVNILPVFKEL